MNSSIDCTCSDLTQGVFMEIVTVPTDLSAFDSGQRFDAMGRPIGHEEEILGPYSIVEISERSINIWGVFGRALASDVRGHMHFTYEAISGMPVGGCFTEWDAGKHAPFIGGAIFFLESVQVKAPNHARITGYHRYREAPLNAAAGIVIPR